MKLEAGHVGNLQVENLAHRGVQFSDEKPEGVSLVCPCYISRALERPAPKGIYKVAVKKWCKSMC